MHRYESNEIIKIVITVYALGWWLRRESKFTLKNKTKYSFMVQQGFTFNLPSFYIQDYHFWTFT